MGHDAWASLQQANYSANSAEVAQNMIGAFPEPIKMAVTRCRLYLNSGISALFGSDSPELAQAVISILSHRIGANAYLEQYP
jgi:hypothetical protein